MVNFVVKIKLISFSPSCATLGNVPNTDIYKNTKDYKNVRHISMLSTVTCHNTCKHYIYFKLTWYFKNVQIYEIPGIKIFKCNSPIYFANIDYFKERLREEVSLL